MFLDIRIFHFPGKVGITFLWIRIFPYRVSFQIKNGPATVGKTFCSGNYFFFLIAASTNLPGSAMRMHAIIINIVYTEEVVLVACHSSLSAAPTDSLYGDFPYKPVHHIYFMNKLLHNMVA